MEREKILLCVSCRVSQANVVGVDIPTNLASYNTTNNTLRVRVAFMYTSEADTDPNSCMGLLRSTTQTQHTLIANLDGYVIRDANGQPTQDQTPQAKVNSFTKAVLGKSLVASVFSVSVADLVSTIQGLETITSVNNGNAERPRNYRFLEDVLLDNLSENQDVKLQVFNRLQVRLVKQLADKKLFAGDYVPQVQGAVNSAAPQQAPAGVTFAPAV